MSRYLAVALTLILSIVSHNAASAQDADIRGQSWRHFAWGAEVGGAADLTSNDLSSINLSAFFGYQNSWIDVIGVGASVNMMVSSSVRSFPVYAMFRTSFSSRPKLAFMDLRGGIAINNPTYGHQQTGLYVSPGIGFNLARSNTFCSYLMLSYVYNGMKPFDLGDRKCDVDGLSMACLRLGIRF